MTLGCCSREPEIMHALKSGHWPEACDAELRAHVNGCRRCGDFVLVTQALRRARADFAGAASLVSPGVLWWRAQLRRRNAALQRIERPISMAQVFAWLVTLLAAAGLAMSQWGNRAAWLPWLSDHDQSGAFRLHTLWSAVSPRPEYWNLMLLIPSLGVLALLSALVLYLAAEKQ